MKKDKKLINICLICIYVVAVLFSCIFLKPQQYNHSIMQKSKQVAEEITFKGLKNLKLNDVNVEGRYNDIDINTLFEKGLVNTDHTNVRLDLSLDDMDVFFEDNTITFDFHNFTKREQLAKDIGLYPEVKYKIVDSKLQEDIYYSKVAYWFMIFVAFPILIIAFLAMVILIISGCCCLISFFINYRKNEKKEEENECGLNFKLVNSWGDDPK